MEQNEEEEFGQLTFQKPEGIFCALCLEPVTNFICVECLGEEIKKILAFKKSGLTDEFRDFHENLVEHFSFFHNKDVCIKCRNVITVDICVHCYINEVIELVSGKDKKLEDEIRSYFIG
ncbi:MAG: hypothetical protein JSV92_01350 [archaeon]|nr:MAG: hypothetical protein JSV92_01350 [archaeon]